MKKEVVEVEVIEEVEAQPVEIIATAGKIEANFDFVEEKVKKALEFYEGITPEAVMQLDMKEAKKCRAELNKMNEVLEAERKRIKREYLKPLEVFEARVKEIESLIQKPLGVIKEVISERELEERKQRMEHLEDIFYQFLEQNALDAFAVNVTFDMISSREWANASYPVKKAENEVCDRVAEVMADWQGLMSAKPSMFCPDETERVFWRTLSLAEALRYDKEQSEAQLRIDEFHQSLGIEEPEKPSEPIVEPIQEEQPTTTYIVTVEVTEAQKDALINTLKSLNIHGTIRRA